MEEIDKTNNNIPLEDVPEEYWKVCSSRGYFIDRVAAYNEDEGIVFLIVPVKFEKEKGNQKTFTLVSRAGIAQYKESGEEVVS